MRTRAFVIAAIGMLFQCAAAADGRPQLTGISTVRIANYGTPSTVLREREQVNAIVGELRQLRGKAWRRADTRLSCYATMVLLSGDRTVTLFRISLDGIVERAPGKGQSVHSLAVGPDDLPKIGLLLADIPPPKDCN